MSANRVALISNDDPNVWGSCRTITPNLRTAYELAFGDQLRRFAYPRELADTALTSGARGIWESALAIVREKPATIAFSDHEPHPEMLVRALSSAWPTHRKRPTLIFHVFGDFGLNIAHWRRLEKYLREFPVRFVCASQKHAALINGLMHPVPGQIAVSGFPVDTQKFAYDPTQVAAAREFFGFQPDEVWCLYAGRVSMQKNVMLLAHLVEQLRADDLPELRMAIAGRFDDLGAAFFGKPSLMNDEFINWRYAQPKLFEAVRWLGVLGHRELARAYHACDLHGSLSLHHDEDFGMSPAESLANGMPNVLSDWGGYSSFAATDRREIQFVRVRLTEQHLAMSHADIKRALRAATALAKRGRQPRAEASAYYVERLGMAACAQRLRDLHEGPAHLFGGFNSRAESLTSAISKRPVFPLGTRSGTFYAEIYENYALSPQQH